MLSCGKTNTLGRILGVDFVHHHESHLIGGLVYSRVHSPKMAHILKYRVYDFLVIIFVSLFSDE
jgi:hypothetical protein